MHKYLNAACIFVLVGLAIPAGAVSYVATDIGSFSGLHLNDSGQIAGTYNNRAAVREADGTITYVPSLWSNSSYAYGISNSGYVVGLCYDTVHNVNAPFRWKAGSDPQQLVGGRYQDYHDNIPYAVNDLGQSVGYLYGIKQTAAFWDADGNLTTIPGLSTSANTYASDISNNGQIIGNDGKGNHGFVWSKSSSSATHLEFRASAINNNGWIVGNRDLSTAVVQRPGESYQTLSSLAGWTTFSAEDINDSGQILGQASDSSGNHIVVWNPDGNISSIIDTGWMNLGLSSINNSGQILGQTWVTDNNLNTVYQNYIWTPIVTPEPSSLAALAAGLFPIAFSLRRRRPAGSC